MLRCELPHHRKPPQRVADAGRTSIHMITKLCVRDSRHHVQENLDVAVAVTPRWPHDRVKINRPDQLTGLISAQLAKPGVNQQSTGAVRHADIIPSTMTSLEVS